MADTDIRYSYKDVPTIKRFSQSDARVRCLMGPFGSGKSSGSVIELVRRAHQQEPGPDGIRRTRFAVIRNTYPQLRDTTIKTVHDWLPPSIFGEWKSQDSTYIVKGFEGVEFEIMFRALDRPDQVSNLLSLELTGAWVNEAREVPKAIVDGLDGRIGRYPSARRGGPTWHGMWFDTNPPDDDHWMYEMFEVRKPDGWEMFQQPSGLAPNAENLKHLPNGYYHRMCEGKDPEWVKVYVHGQYGSVHDGKPIYPEFRDDVHVSSEVEVYRGLPLLLGFDFGLTPACAIGQVTPRGQLIILDELVSEDMGIRRFARDVVKPYLAQHYDRMRVIAIGDPAGGQRGQTDEKSCLDELNAAMIPAQPASTNVFTPRREAVAGFLSRMTDGKPGFLLSDKCTTLRKGFNGGYKFRRLKVSGDERYTDSPDKNRYSHIHDALQYLALHAEYSTGMSPVGNSPARPVVTPPSGGWT